MSTGLFNDVFTILSLAIARPHGYDRRMEIAAPPMSSRRSAVAAWLAIVGGASAAIVVLHQLGNDPVFSADPADLWTWLGEVSPEVAFLGLGRWAALGLSYWIAGSTLLYTAARASQIPRLIRSVEWIALPAVRRLSERVVAVSLTVSTLTTAGASVAVAADPPGSDLATDTAPVVLEATVPDAGYVPVPAEDARVLRPVATQDEGEGEPYVPSPAGETWTDQQVIPPPFLVSATLAPTDNAGGADDVGPAARGSPAPALSTPAATRTDYTVRTGDHLWGIAEHHLEATLGRIGSDAEIATYWSHVIDVNRSRLRSGDPDLIFPGEVIECPPVGDAGTS